MRKLLLTFVISAFVLVSLAPAAPADDILYISKPTLMGAPQLLPRYDASLWNMDFRYNPALLSLDCPYELIYDTHYTGGYRHISSSGYGVLDYPAQPNPHSARYTEMDYYAHGLGADAGFALALNDRTNLAAIFGYRWDHVSGDGDFLDEWERSTTIFGSFNGSLAEAFDAHTYGLSVLLSHAFNDTFTLGAGIKYAYTMDLYDSDMAGSGAHSNGNLEDAYTDRELILSYHRIAPVIGVFLKPSDSFSVDASVEAGFSVGDVHKDSIMYDNYRFTGVNARYTEDLDSKDLFGWDIAAKIKPEVILSDAVSVPFILAFNSRDFRWGVDGVAYRYFAPFNLLDVAQGPGTIDYDVAEKSWDLSLGAGVEYRAGWGTLAGFASGTHKDLKYGYDMVNMVDGPRAAFDGLSTYAMDDHETRDILSLAIVYKKEFSPMVYADLGLRYDIGWGHREVETNLMSEIEVDPNTPPPPMLTILTDGRDVYQDMTLTTHLTVKPIERLEIALGGMVRIPLDTLDYHMDGTSTGLAPLLPAEMNRPGYFFNGPFSLGYESTGWDWGGLLSVTYEFGCVTPVPPVTPVIEPKLEPMSMK